MKVYVAAHDVPDYSASPAPVHSIHLSLEEAIAALYPDRKDFQDMFRPERKGYWIGPDGFGSVREVEVFL